MCYRNIFIIGFCLLNNTISATEYSLGIDKHFSQINIIGKKSHPEMNGLRFSMMFDQQIGLEITHNKNYKNDDLFNSKIQLDKANGIYLRLVSQKHNAVTMEIDLGYTSTEMTVIGTDDFYFGTDKYDGFSYRIIAEQDLQTFSNTKIRVAYESLYDDKKIQISGYTLGFSYQF